MVQLLFWKKWFWRFLFEKPWTWKKVWCRLHGHPNGVWWFNSHGLEPDTHCKDCNDDLDGTARRLK